MQWNSEELGDTVGKGAPLIAREVRDKSRRLELPGRSLGNHARHRSPARRDMDLAPARKHPDDLANEVGCQARFAQIVIGAPIHITDQEVVTVLLKAGGARGVRIGSKRRGMKEREFLRSRHIGRASVRYRAAVGSGYREVRDKGPRYAGLAPRTVDGRSCFEPREPVYVCMPVHAATAGQIYALHEDFAGRYFATYEEEGGKRGGVAPR